MGRRTQAIRRRGRICCNNACNACHRVPMRRRCVPGLGGVDKKSLLWNAGRVRTAQWPLARAGGGRGPRRRRGLRCRRGRGHLFFSSLAASDQTTITAVLFRFRSASPAKRPKGGDGGDKRGEE
ncbi:hypothetical protein AOQ84DRAFT_23319 [Glonium stellatum]|uniref:Uncharacterized protein n=1 Tax=Glonium stellatum TaxID=574774 RepID=A0A8E2F2R3_9PEZI|nr:hypothetical protein AOQ84DRAFT_23319 [Glonium stellatum]